MTKKPFHDRDGYIWMDGKMLSWREANIHVLTHALHYGTQVFEGERAYEGKIFKSRQHTERLMRSAELIYMPMEYTVEQIEQAKREVLEANGLKNCYIRACAWRGSAQMGVDVTGTDTRTAIALWEWSNYFDDATREKGIAITMSKHRKPAPEAAPVQSKCAGLYVLGTMAKYEAKQAGFTDALLCDFEGYLAEASAANLFIVRDGVLMTPIADRFLNGITRQTIIELAKKSGIKVEERRIKPEELAKADEIFLSGTAAEITAVGRIDDREYKVGPVTKALQAAYSLLVRA